jgi:uncharacterized protein DUF4360
MGHAVVRALVGLVLIGGPARGLAQEPAVPGLTIDSLTYEGSGCPPGSVGQSLNDARTVLTLMPDGAVAASGAGVASAQSAQECQVTLTLRVPAGAALTPLRLMLRGSALLPAGVTGVVASSATFAAQLLDSHDEARAGPTADDYLVTREFDLATSEAVESLRFLTVATSLSLPVGAGEALLTLDSLDVAVGTDDTVLTLSVSRDTPLPVVEVTPSVLPNTNGWNNTDVTVSFTCTPPEGFLIVPEVSSLAPVTLTASGTATGTCGVADETNSERQSSASVWYAAQIDKELPTLTVTVPVGGGTYRLGAAVASVVACADAPSGIESCDAPAQLDTATLGPHTFTAVARRRTASMRAGASS